jgi:hypothetical protein
MFRTRTLEQVYSKLRALWMFQKAQQSIWNKDMTWLVEIYSAAITLIV